MTRGRDRVRRRDHLRGAHRPARCTPACSIAGHALDHIRLARAADCDRRRAGHGRLHGARRHRPGGRPAHGDPPRHRVAPVLLVPAMNDRMWAHAQTQRQRRAPARARLPAARPRRRHAGRRRGKRTRDGCRSRRRSSRTSGGSSSAGTRSRGKSVLVTAGPTREPLDPVRFISNHSSGQDGGRDRRGRVAARRRRHARRRPAQPWRPPWASRRAGASRPRRCATRSPAPAAAPTLLVMAAAPADFRPAERRRRKDQEDRWRAPIELATTPDILVVHERRAAAGRRRRRLRARDGRRCWRTRRRSSQGKELDLIVAQRRERARCRVRRGHQSRDHPRRAMAAPEQLPLLAKRDVADAILDRVEGLLDGR